MTQFMYAIVEAIARIHSKIISLNDAYEYDFTDKELHFIVIGVLGMLMLFVVYPVFKWLSKKNLLMIVAWVYVFTLIIVFTFAIEIGQGVTGTGNMEFGDIVFGIAGFIVMFIIFAFLRMIWHYIRDYFKKKDD